MKNIFFFLGSLLLLYPIHSTAQFNEDPVINLETIDKPLLNWGYFLGFNQYDFKFDYKEDLGPETDILVETTAGFNVGLIGELRLNKYLDLRFEPGLHYTQRNLGFRGVPDRSDTSQTIREVQSTYINFPLLLKYSAKRLGNWKPVLIGGLSTSINLGSNEDSLDDNFSGTFRLTTMTYYYEIGFGIEFYTEYFKFTPSIRGTFALSDELVPDNRPDSPWTGNIESLKTRGIFINFTFE